MTVLFFIINIKRYKSKRHRLGQEEKVALTEYSKSIVECDDDDLSIAGPYAAVVRVSTVCVVGLIAVNEDNNWVFAWARLTGRFSRVMFSIYKKENNDKIVKLTHLLINQSVKFAVSDL